jgi:hypothetical protein
VTVRDAAGEQLYHRNDYGSEGRDEFIVHAVNNHAKLRDALQAIVDANDEVLTGPEDQIMTAVLNRAKAFEQAKQMLKETP